MNFKMPSALKSYYYLEISRSKEFIKNKDFVKAWNTLERSHILGQGFPIEHTYSHWLMLKFGFMIRDFKEVTGQLPRLFIGGVKSFVGVIPVGNTGGANVPPLKPMKIPTDLSIILETHKNSTHV